MTRRDPVPQGPPLELSVVVPTRNEAGNVPLLLQRLRTSLAEIPFEVLFVDDSDDQTPQLLREAARKDGRVHVWHRPPGEREGGLSTAVVLGMARARGRLVCVMDGDLQHPPEVIPELLAAELAGADVVVASRYVAGGSRKGLGGNVRQVVSRAATLVAHTLFAEARRTTDPLAGFFLCRASLLAGLEFRPVGFKILLELLVCSDSPQVADIPLSFQSRGAGESKATAAQGLLYLHHVWSLVRDVPGSARRWKFAAVGATGLVLLLGLLQLGTAGLHWKPLAAWALAFAVSLLWNFALNLRLTFADARRERTPLLARYIASALNAGGVQLVVFLILLSGTLPLLVDGLVAAVAGMTTNAILSRRLLPPNRRALTEPIGLEPLLARLIRVSGADLAAVLDAEQHPVMVRPEGDYQPGAQVRDLCRRAATGGVPVLWTAPPSNRPQARTNVGLTSLMVLPVEGPGPGTVKIVLQRGGRAAFTAADLEAVMRHLHRLGRFPTHQLPALVASHRPQLARPRPAR